MQSSSIDNPIKISVQAEDFSIDAQYRWLKDNGNQDGAIVTFVGTVRDMNNGKQVQKLCLEHYPGMAEKTLLDIVQKAYSRWTLGKVSVVHRFGDLDLGDQIVFVGVTSKHRGDAFGAAEFVMDFLKTNAPFWKKERTASGEKWVEARSSDQEKTQSWND